jgi:hypothetical protein
LIAELSGDPGALIDANLSAPWRTSAEEKNKEKSSCTELPFAGLSGLGL